MFQKIVDQQLEQLERRDCSDRYSPPPSELPWRQELAPDPETCARISLLLGIEWPYCIAPLQDPVDGEGQGDDGRNTLPPDHPPSGPTPDTPAYHLAA